MRFIANILPLLCGVVMFISCSKDEAIKISASEVLLVFPQVEFTVNSESDWRLESDGDNFQITPTEGLAGETKVVVKYTHNEKKTENKEAILTITDGENSNSIKVIQEPQKLDLIPKSLEFPSQGGTKEFKVESNCPWGFTFTVVENEGLQHKWLNLSWNTITNTIYITLEENTSKEPRHNKIINIAYGGWFIERLDISQKGKE
jgi:hypothetical protein